MTATHEPQSKPAYTLPLQEVNHKQLTLVLSHTVACTSNINIVHRILNSAISTVSAVLRIDHYCIRPCARWISPWISPFIEARAMDRQRRPSLGLGISTSTSTSTSTFSAPRLKHSIPKQIDVPSFSSFQAQTPRVTASPVRRKPLPATASPILPQLSSGGAVVAVGEDESSGHLYNSTYLHDPPPTAHHVPWLPTHATGSPTLLVRDLDQ